MTIWGIKPFIPPLATPLRTPSCDGHTNRQTHSHSIHCGGIASCGKTIAICATLLKQYCIKHCDNFNTAVLEQPWSYVGCMYTAYAGMLCDLDETVGRTCVLQSPSITSAWTCMLVSYQLSSHDVQLALDLLVDGVPDITHTLLANETVIKITNEYVGSSVSLRLTASRYLVSTADYEFAIVSSVTFPACTDYEGISVDVCFKCCLCSFEPWHVF